MTPEGLRGRVVLVDFWTYTCINWLRTAPYLRAWHAKYRDLGLTVVGAHTPEFGFEGDVDNVIARTRGFGVEYPVAIDTDYGVWQAFANHFWPAVYIADTEGRIRYHHFGEGEYAMTEMVIQQLLLEAGADGIDPDLVSVEPQGFEVAADWSTLRTPETYVSFGRSAGFASPAPARFDEPYDYPEPSRLDLNQWAPVGVDSCAACRGAGCGTGPHRLPVSGARRQPRDGTSNAWLLRAVPSAPGRIRTGRRPRVRCRRTRRGQPHRPAPLPADQRTRPRRRAPRRDRVPRAGR